MLLNTFEEKFTYDQILKILEKDFRHIKYLKKVKEEDLPESFKLNIVKRDPFAIKYMKNPSPEIKAEALINSPTVITHIKRLDDKIVQKILEENPKVIYELILSYYNYVKDTVLSKETQLKIVSVYPQFLEFLKNPYLETQIKALSKMPTLIKSIKNPSPEIVKYLFEKGHINLIRNYVDKNYIPKDILKKN